MTEPDAPPPATRVGKYALTERLGEGGMGEVWRAWDAELSRWVAVKLPRLAEPDAVARFLREATLAARLAHPGITRVYDAGTSGDQPWLAMELVDGRSLDGIRLERRRAAEVVRDAARALQHAHEQGVIHRDLKPANLLESKAGQVFVTDFGLARSLGEGNTLTLTGMLLGSPGYMSPEQALSLSTDPRTDVYGLGACLHALLTGAPPVAGDSLPDVIRRIADGRRERLEPADDLAVVAGKAMERAPSDRYPTAGALADDLDRWLAGEPVLARPIGPLRRATRWARRRPRTAALAAAGLVAVVGVTLAFRAERARDESRRTAEGHADQALALAESMATRLRAIPPADQATRARLLADLEATTAEALAAAPGHGRARRARAQYLVHADRYAEAEGLLDAVLRDHPEDAEARSLRGFLRFSRTEVTRTLQFDGPALRYLAPEVDEPSARALRLAEEDFAALPEDHPQRPMATVLPALSGGDYAKARAALEGMIARRPYDAHARVLLGWVDLYEGRFAQAADGATRLLDEGVVLGLALETRAVARAGLGEHVRAVEDAERVLARDPTRTSIRWILAMCLLKVGRLEASVAAFDALLAVRPDDAEYLVGRAHARGGLRDAAGAASDARRAAALAPGNAGAHFLVGAHAESHDEALAALDRALSLDPALSQAHAQRGRRWFAKGDREKGREAYDRATTDDPATPAWWLMLGLDELEADEPAAAARAFEAALRIAPDVVPGLVGRGRARYATGDFAGAAADLERASALDPEWGKSLASLLEAARAAAAR